MEVETTIVPYQDTLDPDFIEPSKWHVLMATGDLCYYRCRSRTDAQSQADLDFGVKKYNIRSSTLEKSVSKQESGELTCR